MPRHGRRRWPLHSACWRSATASITSRCSRPGISHRPANASYLSRRFRWKATTSRAFTEIKPCRPRESGDPVAFVQKTLDSLPAFARTKGRGNDVQVLQAKRILVTLNETSFADASKPLRLLELEIKPDIDRHHDGDRHRITPDPLELGHVLEVHAVDARDHGRHTDDG